MIGLPASQLSKEPRAAFKLISHLRRCYKKLKKHLDTVLISASNQADINNVSSIGIELTC